jgi:DNA primase
MASDIERIKEKLAVEEVVSWYVKLAKVGGQFKGKCPFHSEKTPSFYVSPDRGTYYCFGCGAKGDILTFVQEFERLDFRGALKMLADKAGIELTHQPHDGVGKQEKETLYDILERATKFYEKHLRENSEALAYLHARGITDEVINEWRIGFAPEGWDMLYTATRKSGTSSEMLVKAGLIKSSEKGPGFYDRFRSRIMFPLKDPTGRTVGFSGRIFGDAGKPGSQDAKYLNSPETELFKKSYFLYGLDKAKDAMRKDRTAVLVEGQFDLILSHASGVKTAVATSGTALTLEHAKLIRRYADKIVLAYDGDDAGKNAALKAARLAVSAGLEVYAVLLQGGQDPADLVLKDPQLWHLLISNPRHVVDFILDVWEAETEEKKKLSVLEEHLMPLIASVLSPIQQDKYMRTVSGRTGIADHRLRESLDRAVEFVARNSYQQDDERMVPLKKEQIGRLEIVKSNFISGMAWLATKPEHETLVKEYEVRINEFMTALSKTDLANAVLSTVQAPTEEMLFQGEVLLSGSTHQKEFVADLWENFKTEILKQELAESLSMLKKAEFAGKQEESARELERIKRLTAELHGTNKKV